MMYAPPPPRPLLLAHTAGHMCQFLWLAAASRHQLLQQKTYFITKERRQGCASACCKCTIRQKFAYTISLAAVTHD
jgi:hypothetical protein